MSSTNQPFYLEKRASLPLEIWLDIAGFEDYYQASNFGRIRSLDRWVNHKSSRPILVRGKILSQSKRLDKNLLTGEPTVALRIGVMKEGVRYDLTVRRIIYQAFIGPLDERMVVINKDGDGYNNRVENLELVTNSQKGKRVYERQRVIPALCYLDRSKFKKTGGGYSRQKAVRQSDLEGNWIADFPSIAQAARTTRIGEKEIIMVAKERWKHYRGNVFEYLAENEERDFRPL